MNPPFPFNPFGVYDMVIVRKKFVRGAVPASKNGKPTVKPGAKKQKRPGKAKNGEPFASSIPTAAEIELSPTLLSGTGRGNPACPPLVVKGKPPEHVVVSEGENGAVRATVHGIEVTGILRAIGKAGYKWQYAATWLTQLRIPLRRNTIVSQVSAGKGYDPKRWGRDKQTLRGPIPDNVPGSVFAELKRLARTDPAFKFEGE